MKILSIETSSDIASCSILEDNNLILELKDTAIKSHSETLMPLIDNLLHEANLDLDNIDLFTVDNGPRFFYRYSNWTFNCKSFL